MSFIERTNQQWKVATFLLLMIVSGISLILMIWRINDSVSVSWIPGEVFLSLAGVGTGLMAFLWLWVSVRCPRCRSRVAARILKNESVKTWLIRLFEFGECAECGFTGLRR